jgi:hypothetical protein
MADILNDLSAIQQSLSRPDPTLHEVMASLKWMAAKKEGLINPSCGYGVTEQPLLNLSSRGGHPRSRYGDPPYPPPSYEETMASPPSYAEVLLLPKPTQVEAQSASPISVRPFQPFPTQVEALSASPMSVRPIQPFPGVSSPLSVPRPEVGSLQYCTLCTPVKVKV